MVLVHIEETKNGHYSYYISIEGLYVHRTRKGDQLKTLHEIAMQDLERVVMELWVQMVLNRKVKLTKADYHLLIRLSFFYRVPISCFVEAWGYCFFQLRFANSIKSHGR